MSDALPREHESTRRSRTREELLLALARLKTAHLARLAEAAGVTPRQARLAMHGALPHYRPDLSPLALGWAVEVVRPRGRAYAITSHGLRRAREVDAERRRAARRTLARAPPERGRARLRRPRG